MWSLKITTEQRYKYFEPILPNIKTDIKLFWDNLKNHYEDIETLNIMLRVFNEENFHSSIFKSFIIERALDNQYQITFYE